MAEIQAAQLTLTASEMLGSRWYYEREKLRRFPAFVLLGTSTVITAAEGAIDTQYSNTYGFRITLNSYPYALPKVYPKDWTPHPLTPHRYNDGSLCIMRSAQWHPYFTVALVVAKTAIWLGKYELWKRNNHIWPGLEQKH
jgi:hypothetical protein